MEGFLDPREEGKEPGAVLGPPTRHRQPAHLEKGHGNCMRRHFRDRMYVDVSQPELPGGRNFLLEPEPK